jgi:acetyltransferase-like isoleucine patch superfamily enzyme
VLGANVVVQPDVTIGEGTIVGSQSLVTRSLPSWSICIGAPARVVAPRESETINAYEQALLAAETSAG